MSALKYKMNLVLIITSNSGYWLIICDISVIFSAVFDFNGVANKEGVADASNV